MYTITKHITPKRNNPFKGVLNACILVIAIPVVMIALTSLLLYFSALWLWNLPRRKNRSFPEASYHIELPLVEHEKLQITMVEDELDTELTGFNEAWTEQVYNRETCLYRAKTNPVIPELQNKIMAFYLKELEDGVILQVLDEERVSGKIVLDTQLVFLAYDGLKITRIGTAGPFFLFNHTKNNRLILGMNNNENLRLELGCTS